MNIIVAQSGGPTCAINSSLLGVFKGGLNAKEIDIVYGSLNGIEGILNDNIVNLNEHIKTEADMELVRQTPATLLKSCRYKLPEADKQPEVYETIKSNLEKHGIGAFFYIGGNDSMDTVNKVSAYFKKTGCDIKVIGVPKTIDNDLMCTDHTPGFGSAAKYVATTLKEIARDCTVYNLKSVTIIEIMGRDTGWLTAASSVLHANGEDAPHLIYLPEVKFSKENFVEDITNAFKKQNTVIVAVSEGVQMENADFMSGATDNFGHKYLSGIGRCLENIVRTEIGCKVRSIELNLMQRCSSHLASKTDLDEAEIIGTEAVKTALAGGTGKVMTFKRVSNNPYKVEIESANANEIANAIKYVPTEWINERGNGLTKEAIDYILPLMQGEIDVKFEEGLPKHFKID